MAGYDDACFDFARMGCSGDVAINPGPVTASTATTESIKCQICRKNVASDYRALTCDSSNHIIGFTFDSSCSECSSISCVLALNVPHFAGICYIGSSSSKAFFANKCETYLIKDNRLQPARALCCFVHKLVSFECATIKSAEYGPLASTKWKNYLFMVLIIVSKRQLTLDEVEMMNYGDGLSDIVRKLEYMCGTSNRDVID